MISDSFSKGLKLLGLSDLSSKIYLSLVKNPNRSIISLAKDFVTNRNAVYAAINELEEIGLLYPKKEYERTQEVASPSKIASLLEIKRHEDGLVIDSFMSGLSTVLADLYSTKSTLAFKTYRTKEQIIAITHQLYFESKDEICFLGNEELLVDLINFQFLQVAINQRLSHKVPIKALISQENHYRNKQKPNDAQELRSYRKLPGSSQIDANLHIVNDSLFIINPVVPMGYLVRDPIVTRMFKIMFGILWSTSEPI